MSWWDLLFAIWGSGNSNNHSWWDFHLVSFFLFYSYRVCDSSLNTFLVIHCCIGFQIPLHVGFAFIFCSVTHRNFQGAAKESKLFFTMDVDMDNLMGKVKWSQKMRKVVQYLVSVQYDSLYRLYLGQPVLPQVLIISKHVAVNKNSCFVVIDFEDFQWTLMMYKRFKHDDNTSKVRAGFMVFLTKPSPGSLRANSAKLTKHSGVMIL